MCPGHGHPPRPARHPAGKLPDSLFQSVRCIAIACQECLDRFRVRQVSGRPCPPSGTCGPADGMRSNTVTLRPALAMASAAMRPAGPAPITAPVKARRVLLGIAALKILLGEQAVDFDIMGTTETGRSRHHGPLQRKAELTGDACRRKVWRLDLAPDFSCSQTLDCHGTQDFAHHGAGTGVPDRRIHGPSQFPQRHLPAAR